MANDFDFSDDRDTRRGGRDEPGRLTGHSRVYVHRLCGGATEVSGGDYSHICNPFWPCTATYCCTCAGFVGLSEVRWADTNEPISEYRRRMAAKTPVTIKAWLYGLGAVLGAVPGAGVGLLIGLAVGNVGGATFLGALIGALVVYLVGALSLFYAFGIDYRRMR
jgi:hypothetical protein